jgi:hypothetical protein
MTSIALRTSVGLAALVALPIAAAGAGHDPLSVAALIDRAVDQRLAEARLPASPAADDPEFLRRVTLDITGRIPTLGRATGFLDDRDSDRRRSLIDELLSSREYAQHFASIWGNRLAPPNAVKGKPPPDRFGPWLAEQFQRNRGWDQIVSDLLTADGDMARTPQTAFITANSEHFRPQPSLLAGSAARYFLGVQLRCAECHDHPFAAWKQTDFWGTAAFFGRLRNTSKKGPPFILTEALDPEAWSAPAGIITIPSGSGKAAGQVVRARYLRGKEASLPEDGRLRAVFAAWVTAPENPYFANALVNRTWAHFFGRGLVNPVDDFRDGNPASHPEVVQLLADEFRASGYDLKHLIRCICNSRTYQHSSRPLPANEKDRELCSHMAVKPLSAEAFYDSLVVVLTASKAAPGSGKSKVKVPAPKTLPPEARDDFVRFFRAQGGTEATEFVQGIPQFLKRLNGDLFNGGAPLIDQLLRSGASREEILTNLYLATLARRPTAAEVGLLSNYVSRQQDPQQGYAGALWILLNSGEFVLNH